jgi:hypothetical protein
LPAIFHWNLFQFHESENIKPRKPPQAKLSIYMSYSQRQNVSVLTAKLIVLACLEAFKMVVKLLKWIKI